METKFDVTDEYSIGIKCMHCGHNKLHAPILVTGNIGLYTFIEVGCLKCHKPTFVNFHIVDNEVSVSVTDSEP
jgi:predicted nucleic-acid-binding Zn-ribbon protein